MDFDFGFQHFEHELATLPGSYASPFGALCLARVNGAPADCIVLRPLSGSVGELKRLDVPSAFRGHGLARTLVSTAIDAARTFGYDALVLDTFSSMQPSRSMRHSVSSAPKTYYANPWQDALYFRAALKSDRNAQPGTPANTAPLT